MLHLKPIIHGFEEYLYTNESSFLPPTPTPDHRLLWSSNVPTLVMGPARSKPAFINGGPLSWAEPAPIIGECCSYLSGFDFPDP